MGKKLLFGWLALFMAASTALPSPQKKPGVGLILFEPSGLSAKTWLRGSAAVAGGIGWSPEESHYLHVHVDFLFATLRLASDRNLDVEAYFGAGGKLIFRDFDNAWFRVPLGIDFLLRRSPLSFFFEVVPSFNFGKLKLFGAVGFRYLFAS